MNKYTIKELKKLLEEGRLSAAELLSLRKDPRQGIQNVLAAFDRKEAASQRLRASHQAMWHYEEELQRTIGAKAIAGIDEVGRGPLAGPVVVASVILPNQSDSLLGVNDSKSLSRTKREDFAEKIKEVALAYSIVEIDNIEIDKYNIFEATKLAMLKSISSLELMPDALLIDAMTLQTAIPQRAIVKGDQKSISIAAASIIAKVYRDEIMAQYALDYPEFDFANNSGYGTASHLQALRDYGYTPIHRRSFMPIKVMTKQYHK